MFRPLLTIVFILLFIPFSQAQHIKRKGSLGVKFYINTPDSLKKKLNYQQGAIVQLTLPNTTAANIGIQTNDIITAINDKPIIAPADILMSVKDLRESDNIEVALYRGGKPMNLKGTAVGKPKEISETANVVYGEFAYKNGYVRTIYKTLKGKEPLGTIYFLQGLPCYSMDNFTSLDMTKQALDAMVDRGFAVYRMEKGDMGDNVNTPKCETLGFNEELEMYKAGYKHLLTLKEVDKSKIFLFGHSMGGTTAPLLAEIYQPKGVVIYGAGFKPWMDYLFDAFLIQPQYYGEDLAMLREEVERIKPHVYDYFYNDKPIDEICKTAEGKHAMDMIMSYDTKTKLAASGRSPLCHKELNQHNLAKALKNTNSDLLAIYGECDIAAIHPDDLMEMVDYMNKVHPGKGTFWLAPKTTHTFEEIGTMEEFIKWQSDPGYQQYASTRFNPKVFDHACNWMKEILKK